MDAWLKRYARIGLALVIAVLLIAALSGSAAAAGPVFHTVLPGQTLTQIAAMYGLSPWSIACANGLWNPNLIFAGMSLRIPFGWTGQCLPAFQVPVNVTVIIQPQVIPVSAAPALFCTYRVRVGDTLFSIARRFGTSVWVLAQANHLANPNLIFAGMLLRIPFCN